MGPLAIATIPAVIAAGGTAAQSAINAKTAKLNTDKTIQANKELANFAYSKDLEMWNRSNEYNTPLSQMNRIKQAGLNPNLVYGNGVTGNSSSQLPKYNAPTVDYNYKPSVDFQGMLSSFMDLELKQSQIDNVRAQTNNTNTETALKTLNREKLLTEKPYWSSYAGMKDTDGNVLHGVSKLAWLEKNTKLRESQAEVQKKLLDNAMKEIDLNWYKAQKWLNASTKVLGTAAGAFGVSKLGGLLKTNKPSFTDYKRNQK